MRTIYTSGTPHMHNIHYCTMTGRDNNFYLLKETLRICGDYFQKFIIVDTGSTDDTKKLADMYPNTYIKELPDWKGDWVQAYAKAIEDIPENDWFLFMDADEIPNQLLLDNIHNLIANAEAEGSNNVGLRSCLHIYDWDGKCSYTELEGIKRSLKEHNVFRKHVLVKKVQDIRIPANGGHCSYQPQPYRPFYAPGDMFYNHYKSKFTIARSLFTHGFQYPFSFSGLQDQETMNRVEACKAHFDLHTVSDFMQVLENNDLKRQIAEYMKIEQWKDGHNEKKEIHDLLMIYDASQYVLPTLCKDECCVYKITN